MVQLFIIIVSHTFLTLQLIVCLICEFYLHSMKMYEIDMGYTDPDHGLHFT